MIFYYYYNILKFPRAFELKGRSFAFEFHEETIKMYF